MTLREEVFQNLGNREANGYPITDESDLDVAIDMCTCTDLGERHEPEKLVPFIAEYRQKHA